MLRRIHRDLRQPFHPGDQVVVLHELTLPDAGSVPAGAKAEVVRELENGDRLVVEVLAFGPDTEALSLVRTGVRLEVVPGQVRRNTLSGVPWRVFDWGRHIGE